MHREAMASAWKENNPSSEQTKGEMRVKERKQERKKGNISKKYSQIF